MPLPDFLVLGAARSGTTALHYQLEQHPQIAMSAIKEPNHFVFEPASEPGGRPRPLIDDPDQRIVMKSVSSRPDYERLFPPGEGKIRGEASPLYLYVRETPRLVHDTLPEARLVALLRHPVERAYSHFLHLYRGPADDAPREFEAAVRAELGKGYEPYRSGTHFLRLGRYAEQLARWDEVFPPSSLLPVVYDDYESDPAAVLAGIAGFVGADPSFPFDTAGVYNRSGVARSDAAGAIRRVATRLQPRLKAILPTRAVRALGRGRALLEHRAVRQPPPIDPELRDTLVEYFADDVASLEERLGRSLPTWHR